MIPSIRTADDQHRPAALDVAADEELDDRVQPDGQERG